MKTTHWRSLKTFSGRYFLRGYSKNQLNNANNNSRHSVLRSVEEAIKTNNVERPQIPILVRLGFFVVPTVAVLTTIIGYNCLNGEETYLPVIFKKRLIVQEENPYGINVEKLKQLTMTRLIQKVSINQKFQKFIGLPITSHEIDRFEVYLEYKNLMSYGVEIDPSHRPFVRWVSREYSINHTKLNEILEPMGISDPDYQFQLVDNPASLVRDYKIIVDGRLKVNGNELFKNNAKGCDLSFKGVIDFDHSQNIRFEKALIAFKDSNGNMTVENLW